MEMTLNNVNFEYLTNDEMLSIDCGANWDRVFSGTTLAFVESEYEY